MISFAGIIVFAILVMAVAWLFDPFFHDDDDRPDQP